MPRDEVKTPGPVPGDVGEADESVGRKDAVRPPPANEKEGVFSLRPGLLDIPRHIDIRDPDGEGLRRVPILSPARDPSVAPQARDSLGPIRRDSLGLRAFVKDSWSADLARRRRSPSTLRDVIRSVTSWILLLALSVDVLALLFEPFFLLRAGAPVRAAIAAALAACGLSLFFSIIAAVPVAAIHGAVRFLGSRRGPPRFLWLVPLLVLGWLVVANLAPHKVIHAFSLFAGQAILAALLCTSLVLATAITRIRRARIRIAFGLSITCAAFLFNLVMPPVLTHEPRDLLWLCGVFSFAAVFYPTRRQMVMWPHDRVSKIFGVLVALSLACLLIAPYISADWRTYASNGGRFAPRLARFCRMFVDLDADGFSRVAWGTDCSDWDPSRNPSMRERLDGVDRNCNGKTRPALPTLADRGLTAEVGEPDAAPGEIDRVVLVTIDCFRNDAFTPEVTPRLAKLAERGLRFEKLYSSGARTAMSLPYLLRGSVERPTIAETLGKEKVTTTAIFGYRHPTLEGNVFNGFGTVRRPDVLDHRFRASELTDFALADLRDPAHARAHFLWVHYFDAHGPRTLRVLPPDVRRYPPMAGESDVESALYLSELSFIDESVGRLVGGIEELDQGLKRTIVIMTNDHGEGFGRHGVFEHGVSAFEAITHAPGLLLAPSLAPGTYTHVAAQRDIAATILGGFGLVAKNSEIETFGRSWLRLRSAPTEPLHLFVVTYETTSPFERWGDAPMASIVDDEAKLSVSYVDGITRFYRLVTDPNEDDELTMARPAEVARYRDRLELFRDVDAPPR